MLGLGLRRLLVPLLSILTLSACGSAAALHAPTASDSARTRRITPAFALTTRPMKAADAASLPVPLRVAGAGPVGDYAAPGVLYGVWDPARGRVVRAFGLSDRGTRARIDPSQTFRIASITKTFTATAVLLLVDDGKVDLDSPAGEYVGGLVNALPNGADVTVRELLNMTSGFPDYGAHGDGPFATAVLAPQRVWTPAQVVRAAARYYPDRRGAFSYSNTNYVILGELVSRVSGMSYGAFVQRRILGPLHLRHTRIPSPTATAPVSMHGYYNGTWASYFPPPPANVLAAGHAGQDVSTWSTSAAGAAADGVSTLGDLARWAADDFGDVLLSPATRRQRLTGVPASPLFRGSSYGLGLQIEHGWHWHVGELFGWETLAMANPRTHQVVIVTRNACCDSAFENYLTARHAMPSLAPLVDPVYRG